MPYRTLNDLPNELITQIAGFTADGGESSLNDLLALRATCVPTYVCTTYHLAKLNPACFKSSTFSLDTTGLGLLLRMTAEPCFLNLFEEIKLQSRVPSTAGHYTQFCHRNGMAPGNTSFTIVKNGARSRIRLGEELFKQEVFDFEDGPEAHWMLREILSRLKGAEKFRSLVIDSAFDAVTQALEHFNFDRRILTVRLEPAVLLQERAERRWAPVAACANFTTSVEVILSAHEHWNIAPQYLLARMKNIMNAVWTPAVETLTVSGCQCSPISTRQEACIDYSNIFEELIQGRLYTNMKSLHVRSLFVDGRRLRALLAACHNTLDSLEIIDIKLSSGNWQRTFEPWEGAPNAQKLHIGGLYQKLKIGHTALETAPASSHQYDYAIVKGWHRILSFLWHIRLHPEHGKYTTYDELLLPSPQFPFNPPL